MTSDELKEALLNRGKELWARIEESSSYNQIKDRYDSLAPTQQRLAFWGGVALIVFVVLYIPFTFLETSWEYEDEFVTKRDLIREMYRVQREVGEAPQIPVPLSPEMIRQAIDSYIKQSGFLPEQVKSLSVVGESSSGLLPKKHVQGAVEVSMAKLTIRQVVDVAFKVVTSSPSTKLYEMTITANSEDPKYQDVILKLLALNVPDVKSLTAPPPGAKDKKPAKAKGNTEDDEDDE